MRLSTIPLQQLSAGLLTLVLVVGCSRSEPALPDLSVTPGKRDVPMYGGTVSRNLANPVEKGIPANWSVEKNKEKNLKWSARLGTMAYGGPVIAGGRIFVGTNNEKPRDPKITGDKGVMMCFRESDGAFLWQIVHDKLPDSHNMDTPVHGVASIPAVDGDRLYYVSNRCQLVCADVKGDPATGKGKVLWTYDMIKELGVYPCYLANCSPLIIDDLVFVGTSNGVKPANFKLIAPQAPSFVAINKNTGKLVWKDNSPGKNIMEGQWSSPVAAKVKDRWLVIFAGGDGWLYAFEARTGQLVWKFDCNPKKSVFKPGGRGDRAYMVATPVVWENKVYIATGSNPEDGPGVGHLWCIDITKEPKGADKDVSPKNDNFDPKAPENKDSALVWHHGGEIKPLPPAGREWHFSRTLSTVAIHDGLVYAAELMGYLQCLDARTGKKLWEYDLLDSTWCSPYYADGKVFLGTDGGLMFVFAAGKEMKLLAKIDMQQSLKVPPVACNGTLYVNNGVYLYAIAEK
jgi:outer membrane protein assembly factor BamB